MAFQFSKILHESIEDSIEELCAPYCEPETNQQGFCPTECITYCPPTCYRSIIGAAIPPFPPDIINKGMIDYEGDKQRGSLPFLTPTLVILAILFSISLGYNISKLCKAWYSSRREASGQQPQQDGRDGFIDQDHDPGVDHPIWYIRSVGLQSSVIRSIAICKYKSGEGLVEGTECAVCLSEFQEDETLRLLPNCKHAFHTPCIDKWLGSHTNCPLCRAVIVINQIGLSSPPDQPHGNSGVLDEISQEGVAENQREFERGREHEPRESSIEDEAEGDPQFQSAFKISNQDSKEDLENIDVQPLRKSICLDPSPASRVSAASANANPAQSDGNSDKQFGKFDESRVVVVPVKGRK